MYFNIALGYLLLNYKFIFMFKSQYEAKCKISNDEFEFYTFTAITHQEATNKAKKHAKKYFRVLLSVHYFNDAKFTLENIYTNL